LFPDSAGLPKICPCYCFLFSALLFRKRHSAGESITTTLLSALDSTDPRDRKLLREVLDRLQETVFASRQQLKNYLRLFAENQLQYAWESAQQTVPDRKLPLLPTSATASPPAAGNNLPFRAAERPGEYFLSRSATVEEVFEFICRELEKHFFYGNVLNKIKDVKRYLIAQLALEEQEIFAALFLDLRYRFISFDRLFSGTIDTCTVYRREVAKRALQHNAASVIISHNHPSGILEPSPEDHAITKTLQATLDTVGVQLLDHIIVGRTEAMSFAEQKLM
jgi:hypothetical protein